MEGDGRPATFGSEGYPCGSTACSSSRASLLALALVASACGDSGGDGTGDTSPTETTSAEPKGELTIGVSSAFPETSWSPRCTRRCSRTRDAITRELNLENREIGDQALETGDIDLKPEYTGFELGFWDKATTNGSPDEVAAALDAAAAERGFVIYAISPANNTNVFVTLPATAEDRGLTDLSSVAPVSGELYAWRAADCPDQPRSACPA